MMKKSFGFTLGEILIALGVIGIVATLVIPQLVSGHKSTTAKAQFNSAYSMLSKAIAEMEADDVAVEPSKYIKNSTSFYNELKKYHKLSFECGSIYDDNPNTSICPETGDYKTLNNAKNVSAPIMNTGCFVVNNGMLICVGDMAQKAILINVDINGKNKKPNLWGYDLFTFELVKGGQLLPFGAPRTAEGITSTTYTTEGDCNNTSNSTRNGFTCAQLAVTDEEYFKKLYKGH